MPTFAHFREEVSIHSWRPLVEPGDRNQGVSDVFFELDEDGAACYIPKGKGIQFTFSSDRLQIPLTALRIRDWRRREYPGYPLPRALVTIPTASREIPIKSVWGSSFRDVSLTQLGRRIQALTVWHGNENEDLYNSLPPELIDRARFLKRVAFSQIPLD